MKAIQEYEPTQVARGLKAVCTKNLKGFFSPKEIDEEMQMELRRPFFLPNKKCPVKYSDLSEWDQKALCNRMATRGLLEEIANQIPEPEKVDRETLDLIEQRLKYTFANKYVIEELQFQYPYLARGKYACILDRSTDEIKSFNFLWFDMLEKYAKQHKGLAKEVMHKAYEIYRIDNERGINGRRRLGALISMMPISLAYSSLNAIRNIGRGLGLSEEQAYQFVGTTKENIEENEKKWQDKAKQIIEKEGLGCEFEGEIIIKVN